MMRKKMSRAGKRECVASTTGLSGQGLHQSKAVRALDSSAGIGPGRDDESTTVTGSSVSGAESVATTNSSNKPAKRSIDMDMLAQVTQRSEQWPTFTPPRSESDRSLQYDKTMVDSGNNYTFTGPCGKHYTRSM
jgi:hypothetical protein